MTQIDLESANLTDADLTGSGLSHSSLRSANFTDAKLVNTFLNDADMRKVNLTRCDLTGAADFEEAWLEDAIFNETVMPDGTVRTDI
jgi:uncharacterized protein YjbI with pentapeptide repeats